MSVTLSVWPCQDLSTDWRESSKQRSKTTKKAKKASKHIKQTPIQQKWPDVHFKIFGMVGERKPTKQGKEQKNVGSKAKRQRIEESDGFQVCQVCQYPYLPYLPISYLLNKEIYGAE